VEVEREVEITVNDVNETAYLMQSEPNKKRLLQSIQNIYSSGA